MAGDAADLVVVGAGAIGGWSAVFAAADGARVVVLERATAGQGASSRAAGIVRAQGGTPVAVALGRWSVEFYRRQREAFGADSGFRELGYLLLATTEQEVRTGRERVEMQRALGLDVRWISPDEAAELNPALDPKAFLGASYLATDGCIDAVGNVRAYSLEMQRLGVDLRERTPAVGFRFEAGRVAGVETPGGTIEAPRVLLTGGPSLRAVGEMAGVRIPAGGVRHQVAVTAPDPAFHVDRQAMAFDVGAGLYWRLEEGGLLFGMSNPEERPGEAREIDWPYLDEMRRRLARFIPASAGLGLRKAWAATIDYTPDHLPILGPALGRSGEIVEGLTVASAAGHGMMWGPAVARAAADLALTGRTGVVDVSELGLDRFDEEGRSRLAPDPVALPFPEHVGTPGRLRH
ncbi:MAG: NAD(P)/FAD-dependent oxidoreductase [Actinomycetota bacterium]